MSERLGRPERPERPVLYVVRSEQLAAGKIDTEICLSKQEMKQTYNETDISVDAREPDADEHEQLAGVRYDKCQRGRRTGGDER